MYYVHSQKKGGFEGTFWPFPERFFLLFKTFFTFLAGALPPGGIKI
jgi:hypothetical protein